MAKFRRKVVEIWLCLDEQCLSDFVVQMFQDSVVQRFDGSVVHLRSLVINGNKLFLSLGSGCQTEASASLRKRS